MVSSGGPQGLPLSVLDALRETSLFPYENLSKIAAFHRGGVASALPGALKGQSLLPTGGGGTCFALTWYLHRRFADLGHSSTFIMGDRFRQRNVHCALLMRWQEREYLFDPGYLIFEPLPLPSANIRTVAWICPNRVELEAIGPPGDGVWRLWTGAGAPGARDAGPLKPRFDFRQRPVDESEFLKHWEATFDFPMMDYPVLNRGREGVQFYLQKRNLVVRNRDGSEMRKLDRVEFAKCVKEIFGVSSALAEEALEALARKGKDVFRS